jgi:hypothetical protein
MILAMWAIGSAAGLLVLAARLREARDELARSEEERLAERIEREACEYGVAMALALVLAALAAWYAMPRPPARPALGSPAGTGETEGDR